MISHQSFQWICFQHVLSCLFKECSLFNKKNIQNIFYLYRSPVAINANTIQYRYDHTQTHTHWHISDIDIEHFSILITYHACAVGGIRWMSMRMCETFWHLQHLQGHYLNQHYFSQCVSIKAFVKGRSMMMFPNCLFLSLKPGTFESMMAP